MKSRCHFHNEHYTLIYSTIGYMPFIALQSHLLRTTFPVKDHLESHKLLLSCLHSVRSFHLQQVYFFHFLISILFFVGNRSDISHLWKMNLLFQVNLSRQRVYLFMSFQFQNMTVVFFVQSCNLIQTIFNFPSLKLKFYNNNNTEMDETDQARQGLLVYLQANRQYIQQKVYNEFNVECIELKTLQTLNVPKMSKTIKEIFDFGDNKVYQYFFSHLQVNIKLYIKEQYVAKAIPSFYVLDIQKLTEIVKYCILHGFVKVQKKAPPKVVEKVSKIVEPRQVDFVVQERKIKQPQDQFKHVKPKISTFLDPDKIPQKKQFKLQKFAMPELNVLPRYMIALPKQIQPKQQEYLPPVAPLQDTFLIAHRKTLMQRLQKLFNFYCVQGQFLGQAPSFDRINYQGKSMNLGRFMQFCAFTKLFVGSELPKDEIMTEYKRVAQGKMQIDFELFQRLLVQLDQKYMKLMGHDAINNPVPTYQARLMLNEPHKLGELKKQRNLVFGTRNKEGRQIRQRDDSTRYDNKQLTAHSGRFGRDLSLDFKDKPKQKQIIAKQIRTTQGAIQLKDLRKLKLPKLNWIEQQQQQGSKSHRH